MFLRIPGSRFVLRPRSDYFINPPFRLSMNHMDYIETQVATSEEDTTSITFSEDGFLEELEDLQYTPSPESERVRSG